jgi:hypothetical protein
MAKKLQQHQNTALSLSPVAASDASFPAEQNQRGMKYPLTPLMSAAMNGTNLISLFLVLYFTTLLLHSSSSSLSLHSLL